MNEREEAMRKDAKVVFSGPHGQRLLRSLRIRYGVWNESNTNDPIQMARVEGERAVILCLMRAADDDIINDEEMAKTDYPPLPETTVQDEYAETPPS